MQSAPTSASQTSLLLSSLSRLINSVLVACRLSRPRPNLQQDDMLSFSSQICAAWRAVESARRPGERLFNDVLAEALAGPDGMAHTRSRPTSQTSRIAVRTRYFDLFATRCLRKSGQPTQVVLLGAGMDTRAYRLDGITTAVSVFELDSAVVLDLKEEILGTVEPTPTPLCGLHTRVRADAADPAWKLSLEEAGFERTVRTIWIVEGLLYYLTDSQVALVFANIYELSASGSEVCFSAVTRLANERRGLSSMFKSFMPDPAAYVAEIGFRETVVENFADVAASYGRGPQASGVPIRSGATVCVSCKV